MTGKPGYFLVISILLLFLHASACHGMSVKWEWSGGPSLPDHRSVGHTPIVVNLTDDNGDKVIGIHDIPDIVFVARLISGPGRWGALHAISGNDGHEIFTVTDPALSCNYFTNLAVGDIDGDNFPEIVAGHVKNTSPLEGCPIAFEHNGKFKWMGESSMMYDSIYGAFNIADLDHDGIPEIILGSQVWDNNGFRKWNGKMSDGWTWLVSSCADIDMDGMMEVVHCNKAYRWDGSLLWENPAIAPRGTTAVADFDLDGIPEIILADADDGIYMLNNDGSIRWGPYTLPGSGYSISAAAVADFTGNKFPEIVVAKRSKLTMFNRNGLMAWSIDIEDSSCCVAPSAFDFDQDGASEIVYSDELSLYIIQGIDGTVLDNIPHYSGTWYECPAIADIDNDNYADIVVAACERYTWGGITAYTDHTWADARPIWNQYNYTVTNVYDLGGIPQYEPHSWLLYNCYRGQTVHSPEFPVPSSSNTLLLLLLITIVLFVRLGSGLEF